jgi:ABC-2 type transport system permease protein
MKRRMDLLLLFFKLGFVTEAEYRMNFYLHVFETSVKFITGISVLWVVFSQTKSIGGWSWDELMVVLGLWFITSGLINMVIAPSMKQFMTDVWKGTLDYVLTKPENHQFMASARKVAIFQVIDLLIGISVLSTALVRLGAVIGVEQAIMFSLALFSGGVILYSFWVGLGTLAIWAVKLENLVLVFFAMFEAGRWPAGLYPFWLRYSLTFLVPVGLAITVPSEALLGRLHWSTVLLSSAWAVVTFFASAWFFNFGVRKRYMGASA